MRSPSWVATASQWDLRKQDRYVDCPHNASAPGDAKMTIARMSLKRALIGGVAMSLALAGAGEALAADSAAEDARIARLEAAVASLQAQVQAQNGAVQENLALKKEVGDLETQVADLKQSQATAAAAPPPSPAPDALTASLAGGSPHVATADGRFSANLHALVQLDTAGYFQDLPDPSPPTCAARGRRSAILLRTSISTTPASSRTEPSSAAPASG